MRTKITIFSTNNIHGRFLGENDGYRLFKTCYT